MTRNILGLVLGFVVGHLIVGTVVHAQTPPKVRIDSGLGVCWDQPATAVPTTSTMAVRVTYDSSAPVAIAFSCSGAASPYTCKSTTPAPASALTPGVHSFLIEGATIDPNDGTLSAYATLVSFSSDLYNLTPPQPGSNGRLVKIVMAIAAALIAVWAWFT